MKPLQTIDLFAGIGGFALGLHRAGGFELRRCVEIDTSAQEVLRHNFTNVQIDGDIRDQEFKKGEADVICGGFPCQDISQAGARAGITGKRSGLWREMLRAICMVRPLYVIVENVAALRRRGLGVVLGDLAEGGFDAEWDCIPKAHVGAPDIRDRLWIIAHPQHPDMHGQRSHQASIDLNRGAQLLHEQKRFSGPMGAPLAAALARVGPGGGRKWDAEPQLSRVANGVPSDVVAVKLFGNSVCPRIAEAIGIAISEDRERILQAAKA